MDNEEDVDLNSATEDHNMDDTEEESKEEKSEISETPK